MGKDYNRYSKFTTDGRMEIVPYVEIPKKSTDMYEYYERGKTRLDILSYQYYESPNYGWLILQANPQFGSLEFNIPNGSVLRIPYPLEMSLTQYEEKIKQYKKLYGNG